MRLPLLILSAIAIASPAMAQIHTPGTFRDIPGTFQAQDFQLRQQQEATRQELIQQQNQITSLDAQMRTQQALSQVQAQAQSPILPVPDVTPGRPLPQLDTSQLASIPDSALADSNQKVLDTVNGRR
jgi:hypothetical protein